LQKKGQEEEAGKEFRKAADLEAASKPTADPRLPREQAPAGPVAP
jgi:hypothetical protein